MYLRIVKGGSTQNVHITNNYTKLDISVLRLGDSPVGDLLIKELVADYEVCGVESKPYSNIILAFDATSEELKSHLCIQPDITSRYYIVTEDGNTYERLMPHPLLDETYKKLIKEWRFKLKKS